MKKVNNIIQSLDEGWQFQFGENSKWYSAKVPGCVHLDLLNHKLIPDPFIDLNENEVKWVADRDWDYRLVFVPKKDLSAKSFRKLCFYGIDTYATVILNGQKIIEADNMFCKWEKNVSDILIDGENELIIRFRSPIKEVLPILNKRDYTLPADNDKAGGVSPYTRKAPYHYGWDWGPCLVTSGIWKNIDLIGWDSWFVDELFINQVEVSKNIAKLELEAQIISDKKQGGLITISEEESSLRKEKKLELSIGINHIKFDFDILQPSLWHPIGYGDQHLYSLDIAVHAGGLENKITKRIGLRKIIIEREKDEKGETFSIMVNGYYVFSKGANWIPADSFTPRLTKKDYSYLLKSATMANMNTLRVWGGGIYESDCFYELCDEMGILVWQDFMFACSMYPGDKKFLKNTENEIRYQINRLKEHPSIFLWCGNNEIAWAWFDWGWKDQLPDSVYSQDYKKLFHKLISNACETLDPSRLYWPTSPGHTTDLPELGQRYGSGDNHYWGVWHGGDDFEEFKNNTGRFMSEYGMQSFPDLKTIEAFAKKKDWGQDSAVIRSHQKASLGNKNVIMYIEKYYPEPKNFESLTVLSQMMQSDAIKYAVEAHRRNMPYCMGTLYWQLNDCWPVASWSSVDYYGNWKALHYSAKSFFNYVATSIVEDKNKIIVFILNDKNETCELDARLRLYSFDGSILKDYSKREIVKPIYSKAIMELERDKIISNHDNRKIFLSCELFRDHLSIAKNNYFFTRPKNFDLPDPDLKYLLKNKNGRLLINIEAKTFLAKVHINCINAIGVFSDNFFDMIPNEQREIEFFPKSKDFPALQFSIRSLGDLIKK